MRNTENIAITRAKKLSYILDEIGKIFSSFGYSEVFLPLYEQYDVLKETVKDFRDENIIRFIDRNSGKSFVLRPDFTPQICRTVSSYMVDSPLPLRLSYKGRIFRNVGIDKGIKSEKYQLGLELVGTDSFYGDLEIIQLASSVMDGLSIKDYRIIIGDKSFLNLIFDKLKDQKDSYKKALIDKNFGMIHDLVNKLDYDLNFKELLRFLPRAFGGPEILERLRSMVAFDNRLLSKINCLIDLMDKIDEVCSNKDKIVFDAGESRGLDYYTGLNYDIVSTKNGNVFGGGGRYDNLMKVFGYEATACGLAFNIEEFMGCVRKEHTNYTFDYLVVGWEKYLEANKLREKGFKVFWVENPENKEDLIKFYSFNNIVE